MLRGSDSPRFQAKVHLMLSMPSKSCHLEVSTLLRRVASTPDPDTFEKYRGTPPISIAILLQKYTLLLAESSIYTTNLYHDTPPICIAILLQKY